MSDPAKAASDLDGMAEAGHLVAGRTQAINYWVVLRGENFLLHFRPVRLPERSLRYTHTC